MTKVEKLKNMILEDSEVPAPEITKVVPTVRTGGDYSLPSWVKTSVKNEKDQSSET